MVFSSHLFIFYFLPLTLLLYFASPRRGRHLVLTMLSYSFYGWANPLFMTLMLFSTAVDYFCGKIIYTATPSQAGRKKKALTVSILTNLSLLGFFKYFNFTAENLQLLLHGLGLQGLNAGIHFEVILPLGISFYTFQSMSYTIDIYRGQAKAIRNIIDFACYVSMFPQLVAGPIIRFQEIADQLERRTHTITKFARGAAFICVGLSKKILVANPCGKVADMTFEAAAVNTLDAWYGVTAYSFQIYFDFSAYSDMAIGLGLMLGFVFPKNFDSPYHAASITDFWRRWHISLSTWLRDYVYIPLGGNRITSRRTYINLALVMLVGGLWHGAAWNFVVWGALHGLLLAGERIRGKQSPYHHLPHGLRVAITYVLVLITWVFFRAKNLEHAFSYIGSMAGMSEPTLAGSLIAGVIYQPYYLLMMSISAVLVWGAPQTWNWTRELTPFKIFSSFVLFYTALLALITQDYNPFIYFIF